MIEQRLPIVTRWVLYALGAVEGGRVRQPIDPVARWMLRKNPELLPSIPQPALLTTIRARTRVVDQMLGDEVHRARRRGETLCTWTFAGGFDARWHRLLPEVGEVVQTHHEVEEPELLELKQHMLEGSPYAEAWAAVTRQGARPGQWTVSPQPGARPLVLLESIGGRLDDDGLRLLLQRIRHDAPEARVLAALSALGGTSERLWNRRHLAGIGWRVEDDVQVATRGRLLTPQGQEVCPGMYPFRVLRLSAGEPRQ